MVSYFINLFEDIRYERSLMLLLSLVETDILKQSKFTDDEINIIKNIALDKIHRQKILKEIKAMDLLEKQMMILYNNSYSETKYYYICMNKLSLS